MAPSLQALCDAGGTVNLADHTYKITEPVVAKGPLTITGAGATIQAGPSKERNWPIIEARGAGVRLIGDVTLIGAKPTGEPYNPKREAQHAVQLSGTADALIDGWTVRNTYGDALALTKSKQGKWCRRTTVRKLRTNEIGRQQVSLDAVVTLDFQADFLGKGYRSCFDVEPPGNDWGALGVWIHDTEVDDDTHGYLLSSLGVGHTGSVVGVWLYRVKCVGRGVSCMVNPPPGVRRSDFRIVGCTSDERAERTPMRFNHVDGVTVTGITQPLLKGVKLVIANDCTAVSVS